LILRHFSRRYLVKTLRKYCKYDHCWCFGIWCWECYFFKWDHELCWICGRNNDRCNTV